MIWTCPNRRNCIPYAEEDISCVSGIPLISKALDYRRCEVYRASGRGKFDRFVGGLGELITAAKIVVWNNIRIPFS